MESGHAWNTREHHHVQHDSRTLLGGVGHHAEQRCVLEQLGVLEQC